MSCVNIFLDISKLKEKDVTCYKFDSTIFVFLIKSIRNNNKFDYLVFDDFVDIYFSEVCDPCYFVTRFDALKNRSEYYDNVFLNSKLYNISQLDSILSQIGVKRNNNTNISTKPFPLHINICALHNVEILLRLLGLVKFKQREYDICCGVRFDTFAIEFFSFDKKDEIIELGNFINKYYDNAFVMYKSGIFVINIENLIENLEKLFNKIISIYIDKNNSIRIKLFYKYRDRIKDVNGRDLTYLFKEYNNLYSKISNIYL